MLLLIFWCVLLLISILLLHRQSYYKFVKRNVKFMKPLPLLGNFGKTMLRFEHASENITNVYNEFPKERFIGYFEFTSPLVCIRDLELVKQITIKDFDYFVDHRNMVDSTVDPFWGRNLFTLKGQEWRDMRATLSPAFTSSKIRSMIPFMAEVGEQMILSVRKQIESSKSTSIVLDVKELVTRSCNDAIASCAFGLKVDSHSDPENTFYTMGKEAFIFKLKQILVFFGYNSFPKLMAKLKISLFSGKSKKFFKDLISDTMTERERKNIIRPDMIQLLMEAKKGQLSHDEKSKDSDVGFATVNESSIGKAKNKSEWSEDDIIAQTMVFLLGGFETLPSVAAFALHEVALNPAVQEKLVLEIKEHEVLDLNAIQRMTYLDMVLSEVLRLWTPAFMIDRLCVKDYNLGKPNEDAKEDYIIRKGEGLLLPVAAFHRDPKLFPNPDKFDPERFSDENKHKINAFAYMPFGIGPRNCIGSRFALCVIKVILYQLLQQFEIFPINEMGDRIELCKKSFNMRIKNGHHLGFKARL